MSAGRRGSIARGALLALIAGVVSGVCAAAAPPAGAQVGAGERIGIVNVLDAEITHFHAARRVQDSYLKTYAVNWPVSGMLAEAVRERLVQLNLAGVPVAAGTALMRAREACFLEANLEKPLPKECAAAYQELAASEHLAALIVLGPGLNNANHAQSGPRKDLPEYLRGWCLTSAEQGTPVLLNLTELVLIAITPKGAVLAGRVWGGVSGEPAAALAPPADLRALTTPQLDTLQPAYAGLLSAQANLLLTHLTTAH